MSLKLELRGDIIEQQEIAMNDGLTKEEYCKLNGIQNPCDFCWDWHMVEMDDSSDPIWVKEIKPATHVWKEYPDLPFKMQLCAEHYYERLYLDTEGGFDEDLK